jgi:hypothetical protein
MRIKLLLTGNDTNHLAPEVDMLKERGFLVYTCEQHNAEAFVDEIKPDVVYINSASPNATTTNIYRRLMSRISLTKLPVIYTLTEDDAYLVSPKTDKYNKRSMICDNILDAIKAALNVPTAITRGIIRASNRIQFPTYTTPRA